MIGVPLKVACSIRRELQGVRGLRGLLQRAKPDEVCKFRTFFDLQLYQSHLQPSTETLNESPRLGEANSRAARAPKGCSDTRCQVFTTSSWFPLSLSIVLFNTPIRTRSSASRDGERVRPPVSLAGMTPEVIGQDAPGA